MNRFLSVLVWCFCTTLTAYAQKPSVKAPEKKVFKTSAEILYQGSTVQITYNPAIKGITPATPVTGSVYIYRDFKWQGADLPLIKSDTGYTGSYKIPEGAALLLCGFSVGDSIDRAAKFPYAAFIYSADKKMVPGSYTEWGLIRSKTVDDTMSPLVSKDVLIKPNVLVQLWISKEYNNILVRRNLFFDMARGIKAYLPEKADFILRKGGAEITALPDVTEKELIAVENVYRTVLNNKALADSLKNITQQAYPNGFIKRTQMLTAIYMQRDGETRIQLWNNFVKAYPFADFPYEDYINPILSGGRSFFINDYISVTNAVNLKQDLNQTARLVNSGPFDLINYFYNHFVVYPFRTAAPSITEKQALSLSSLIADPFFKRIETASLPDREVFAPAEWKKKQMTENASLWAYHIELLYKDAQYQEALTFADKVKPYLGYRFIDFNTIYVKLLDHFHKTGQTTAYLTAAIKANTASPAMIELFKAGYVKTQGSTAGFDKLYATLRPENKLNQKHDKLKAAMVHIPAVNFNLKNIKGEQIDLGQLKGKIVVLDFWASWCFPCKAAMPGMQTLVHKYQPGGDVAFFFIATMEESPNYKKLIDDFLAAKKYDFNVLYDAENPETKKLQLTFDNYARILKLSGIPQKIIIDQNGFIRWVAGGFGGDLVELTDEVSYVIDQLKKEKSK